jgi:hypothetical protein
MEKIPEANERRNKKATKSVIDYSGVSAGSSGTHGRGFGTRDQR